VAAPSTGAVTPCKRKTICTTWGKMARPAAGVAAVAAALAVGAMAALGGALGAPESNDDSPLLY